jgi:hypothetical protein
MNLAHTALEARCSLAQSLIAQSIGDGATAQALLNKAVSLAIQTGREDYSAMKPHEFLAFPVLFHGTPLTAPWEQGVSMASHRQITGRYFH